MHELYETQGDVVCLQEVQADHYEKFLYPAMVKDGYEGVFKQKSRESMGQYGKVCVLMGWCMCVMSML